jgi:formylmethanofuran dehydrogenase subunit D
VKLEGILITMRSVAQGKAAESGKTNEAYKQAVGICEIDPEDMGRLGIEEGATVKVSSAHGEVFVKAVKSMNTPHRGLVFIPMGPWANSIIGSGTDTTGMPPFKNLRVQVEVAEDRKVPGAVELIKQVYSSTKSAGISKTGDGVYENNH